MLNAIMENQNTSFANISTPLRSCSQHWSWSQEMDRNISKTCVFIFHHSIQHDEASGYTFYNSLIYFITMSEHSIQGRYCNCMHALNILFMLRVILYFASILFYLMDLCRYIFSRNFDKWRKTQENLKLSAKASCKVMFQKFSLDIDIEWTLFFCRYIISVLIHLTNVNMWYGKLINIFGSYKFCSST